MKQNIDMVKEGNEMTSPEEIRFKKIEGEMTKMKQLVSTLHKQTNLLIAQNTKFKNTIHQQKLDIETLKRK